MKLAVECLLWLNARGSLSCRALHPIALCSWRAGLQGPAASCIEHHPPHVSLCLMPTMLLAVMA